MHAAFLISADSGLSLAVRAAKEPHPQLFVTAVFPPKRFSAELKALTPASFHISLAKIRQSLLFDVIADGAKDLRHPAARGLCAR